MLKQDILEAIAAAYSTTVDEVSRDIQAIPMAAGYLDQFCDALEGAGY